MSHHDPRTEWLIDRGKTEKDVLEGKDGEYILTEDEFGNWGDNDYSIVVRKEYLPAIFEYIP